MSISTSTAKPLKENATRLFLALVFIILSIPWDSSIFKKPFIEDAWYGFSVSRNISNGQGVTIDGEQLTNGFQPLQVLIDALFYLISPSDQFAILLIFSFRITLHISSAILFVLLVKGIQKNTKSQGFYNFVFASYLFNPALVMGALNGLETSLVLFLFLLLIKVLTYSRDSITQRRLLYRFIFVSTALIYSRIDMAIVVACVLLFYIFQRSKVMAIQAASGISLCVIPWLAWNQINFGSIIPISGLQQQDPEFSFSRIGHLFKAVFYNISPWFGSIYDSGDVLAEATFFIARLSVFLWATWVLRKSQKKIRSILVASNIYFVICSVLIGLVLITAYYGTITFATYFFQRYTIYFAQVALLAGFLILGRTSLKLNAFAVLVLVLSAVLYFSDFHSNKRENALYRDQVSLVQEMVPSDQLVGARQSGTLGYHRFKTVNLDGKVNPLVPKRKGGIEEYLRNREINWLCDWPSELEKIIESGDNNWEVVGNNSTVTCLKRVSGQKAST